MNPTSSKCVKQDGEAKSEDLRARKPKWLDELMGNTFFGICPSHEERKNELNRYCISCGLSACKHCISADHKDHKSLKIYRHVYKDVVSLSSIEKYLDISKIQPYKCNKRLVIALYPLPHCGLSSNSDYKLCKICKRKIAEPHQYRYCSISCKVSAFSAKTNPGDPPFLSPKNVTPEKLSRNRALANPAHLEAVDLESLTAGETPVQGSTSYRIRPRKGIPCRAPLF